MGITRRGFLGGLAAVAAGLVVPEAAKILVPERKIWALDRTMVAPPTFHTIIHPKEFWEFAGFEQPYRVIGVDDATGKILFEGERPVGKLITHGFVMIQTVSRP